MNYLSHFIIDQKAGEHYFNSALILPDISKRWIKTFRHSTPSSLFTKYQHALLEGCLCHYKRDKQFHTSAFFEKYQDIINRALKSVPFTGDVQRKWFIAHILTELLIDRTFVKTFPEYVDLFYESLNTIDDVELKGFMGYYGLADSTEFFKFFDQFRSVKYIYYYADNNKFLYSLSRIMMRVGLTDFNEADTQLMLETIQQLESDYMSNGNVLLTELRDVFN